MPTKKTEPEKIRLMKEVDSNGIRVTVPRRYHLKVLAVREEDDGLLVKTQSGKDHHYFHGSSLNVLTCLSCGHPARTRPFTLRASEIARRALGVDVLGVNERFHPPYCDCEQARYDRSLAYPLEGGRP